MDKPYILLSGAIKNIGDFLIFYRAKQLILRYVTENIIEFNRWEELDEKIDIVNNSRGIIICGGPGFGKKMYPNTYPLLKDLSQLEVPVIPFGVGWSGIPENEPLNFDFSEDSKELMNYIHCNSDSYSCRDNITHEILNNLGFNKIRMTGCPVWYDLDSLNKPLEVKQEYKKIVFTTPANKNLVFQVSKILSLIKKKFPKSEVIVSFHRGGIGFDKSSGPRQMIAYNLMATKARLLGFKVVDVSYDLKKIDFYSGCDLHLGYRVHAHLFFLSKRLPSYLISEDGRGRGMNQTLKLPDIVSWDKDILSKFEGLIDKVKQNDLSDLKRSITFIDKSFKEMQKFLEYLSLKK